MNKSFESCGITTDNQCHFLTADKDNQCVQILDLNGLFLYYIDNCCLEYPWGLDVDKNEWVLHWWCKENPISKIDTYVYTVIFFSRLTILICIIIKIFHIIHDIIFLFTYKDFIPFIYQIILYLYKKGFVCPMIQHITSNIMYV